MKVVVLPLWSKIKTNISISHPLSLYIHTLMLYFLIIFIRMNPSPFVRYSFLTVLFGLPGIWFSRLAIHPGMVQRYLAVPTEKEAK